MSDRVKVCIVLLCCFVFSACFGQGIEKTKAPKKRPIRDGVALFAVEGKVVRVADEGYFFEFKEELTDGRASIEPLQRVEILKCNSLDKIARSFVEDKSEQYVKIWGGVKTFEKRNYIFINYYLPLKERASTGAGENEKKGASVEKKEDLQEGSGADEVEDSEGILPEDVLKKLRPEKFIDVKQLKMSMSRLEDLSIVDRNGFVSCCVAEDGTLSCYFTLDAFGQKVGDVSFELLKCQALERVMDIQQKKAVPVRFNISGVATQFEGKYYLLLQRAYRVFNYGNFAD